MSRRASAMLGGVVALVLWRPVCWVLAMLVMLAYELPFMGGRR